MEKLNDDRGFNDEASGKHGVLQGTLEYTTFYASSVFSFLVSLELQSIAAKGTRSLARIGGRYPIFRELSHWLHLAGEQYIAKVGQLNDSLLEANQELSCFN